MSDEEELDPIEEVALELSRVHMLLPAPELAHIEELNVNVKTREVFVGGDITTTFGEWFTVVLRYLESQSTKPVRVWVNTPGGDVNSMFTFHDLVRASVCDITTIGTGQVCSAGVLMLACGNRRLVTESCILMSHRGEDQVTGSLEQMEAQMKVVKWSEEHWSVLMERHTPEQDASGKTTLDAKYWFGLGKKNAEWWITGGEAIVAAGIADAIYE